MTADSSNRVPTGFPPSSRDEDARIRGNGSRRLFRLRSLRARLAVPWLLSVAACLAIGYVLLLFYRQSSAAQVERAQAVAAEACAGIRDRYAFYVAGWSTEDEPTVDAATRRDLGAVAVMALRNRPGVAGGIWQESAGALAFAFPSPMRIDSGSSDRAPSQLAPTFPDAQKDEIAAVNREARQDDLPVQRRLDLDGRTVLLAACPLPGPLPDLTGWAMAQVSEASGFRQLGAGLGFLFLLLVGLTIWLTWLLASWSRSAGKVERALTAAQAEAGGWHLPVIAATGEAELDRIVAALNEAGRRVAAAQARSAELSRQVAASERLAALGRVAAGIAHEIRNPIAAMRLKAENARAGDDERRRRALDVILDQIERLDHLVAELLAMTQRRPPAPYPTDPGIFLDEVAQGYRESAAAKGVALRVESATAAVSFDPELLHRAVGNLVLNAVQHSPAGGTVRLTAALAGKHLVLRVADAGPGVPPALRQTLFDPFVTGRAEGTGLGLAIARELVDAHGGRLDLVPSEGGTGATFEIRLPLAATREEGGDGEDPRR